MWIDEEINHHGHSLAPLAEIVQNLIGSNVRFCQQNRIAGLPAEELAKLFQIIKRLMRLLLGIRALIRYHERRSVHAKAGDSQRKPKTHDLLDLVAHRRIPCIEIGLIRIEPMEIVSLRQLVKFPDTGLLAREYGLGRCIAWIILSPNIVTVVFRIITTSGLKPRMLIGRVVDHKIDDHADATIIRFGHESGKIAKITQMRMNGEIIHDVVSVIPIRRVVEWK